MCLIQCNVLLNNTVCVCTIMCLIQYCINGYNQWLLILVLFLCSGLLLLMCNVSVIQCVCYYWPAYCVMCAMLLLQ